uniref:Uncharacterized protein n=1 Tax=Glossina pallidipes TaxID=7398 RepID=A0A1B0A270_GLOPL
MKLFSILAAVLALVAVAMGSPNPNPNPHPLPQGGGGGGGGGAGGGGGGGGGGGKSANICSESLNLIDKVFVVLQKIWLTSRLKYPSNGPARTQATKKLKNIFLNSLTVVYEVSAWES